MKNPSENHILIKSEGGETGGDYFIDWHNWKEINEYRDFVFNSPAAETVGKLMQSKKVIFYNDEIFVKEPGNKKESPFHVDQPYCSIEGKHCSWVCSIWMPIDPIAKQTCIQFVKGSHRWNRWFYPKRFVNSKDYEKNIEDSEQTADRHWESIPQDISKNNELLTWELQPGDCIAFNDRTVHGAPGNTSLTRSRRVMTTRWMGEDAVFAPRAWTTIPSNITGFQAGQSMESDDFPLVWQQ